MSLRDLLRRPLKDLRISVTDRCNFRCRYCMPLDEYDWIEKKEILSFEEITRLVRIGIGLGLSRVRITGGEPLVRRHIEQLIAQLAALEGLEDLSLTTNGALLSRKATALKEAGLSRINVSLDTLRPQRFRKLTQRGDLKEVLAGIQEARQVGLRPVKINTVIIRGVNEDEIIDLVEFARGNSLQIRFIEYMDVGNANHWSLEKTVSKKEIFQAIQGEHPLQEIGREDDRAPAVDYRFLDGSRLGIIGSVTEPFCDSCSRARLTADGKLVTCLFASDGHDLKTLLRNGAGDPEIRRAMESVWSRRTDRYSDLRWQAIQSGVGYKPEEHRKIEMITLGG